MICHPQSRVMVWTSEIPIAAVPITYDAIIAKVERLNGGFWDLNLQTIQLNSWNIYILYYIK